jgi:hypothetical protein
MRFKAFLSIGVILLCSSIPALAALDLRFTTDISQAPDPATAGNSVTFTVSFKTFGGPADKLKITGGVDGAGIFERTYSNINADLQRTDTFTWTATAGPHTVWFVLDPSHTCGDSNYRNNRIERAITVGSGIAVDVLTPVVEAYPRVQKPDLVIKAAFLKAAITKDKYYYEIKVTNQGDGCVRAYKYKMFSTDPSTGANLCSTCLQGRFAAIKPLCALKAGEKKKTMGWIYKSNFSNSIQEKCSGSDAFPKYKIYNPVYLIVDYDNKVDESNEDNNQTIVQELVWTNECE